MTGTILAICNPLLDIIAHIDDTFLEKYGLKANDAILAFGQHENLYTDLVANYKVDYLAGGSAMNTARGAQWLLPPNSVSYTGCIGDDEFGRRLQEAATALPGGVHGLFSILNDGTPTGTCAVLLTGNGANRSMVARLAAALCFDAKHLKTPAVMAAAQAASVVYITGFFLTSCADGAIALARSLISDLNNETKQPTDRHPGRLVAANLSAPFICGPHVCRAALDSLLEYTVLVFGNDVELRAFAETRGWPASESVEQLASRLAMFNGRGRRAIITQGAGPVVVATHSLFELGRGPHLCTADSPAQIEVRCFNVPVVPADRIADTNGAGDAFVAGYLAKHVQQQDLEQCVNAGIWAGQICIQQSGAVYPLDTHKPTDFSTVPQSWQE